MWEAEWMAEQEQPGTVNNQEQGSAKKAVAQKSVSDKRGVHFTKILIVGDLK